MEKLRVAAAVFKVLYVLSAIACVGMAGFLPIMLLGIPGQDGTEYARRWQEGVGILLKCPAAWFGILTLFFLCRWLDPTRRPLYLALASGLSVALTVFAIVRLSRVC